jgi:hypothetical protein
MFKSKLIFTALALCCSSAYAQSYDVRTLPAEFYASSINNSGYVAGEYRVVAGGSMTTQAALVHPDNRLEIVSPTDNSSAVYGINEGSLMGGYTRSVGSSTSTEATLFRSGGSAIRIGRLPGTNYSDVRKVNDTGVVIGNSGAYRSFVWVPNYGTLESGTMYELQCARATTGERIGLLPFSIAPTQPLIGGNCAGYPVLWWYDQTYDMSGLVPNFERRRSEAISAGGDASCAIRDISKNLNFVVVCYFTRRGGSDLLSVAYNWATGASVEIAAELVAINNQGCAVGTRFSPGVGNHIVKVCADGSVTNVSSMLADPGLSYGWDINDNGQILARFGNRRFSVLTPR